MFIPTIKVTHLSRRSSKMNKLRIYTPQDVAWGYRHHKRKIYNITIKAIPSVINLETIISFDIDKLKSRNGASVLDALVKLINSAPALHNRETESKQCHPDCFGIV